MNAGIAGALLVFTGFWHATEWMMDGRRRDTWALVPVGLIYLLLGGYIVATNGSEIALIIALVVVALVGVMAFIKRKQLQIRPWVIRVFIGIDIVIILLLLSALFI